MEKKQKESIRENMPIGIGLSLAANAKARSCFAGMNDEEKRAVIEASRNQNTKEEMERFISRLENNFE
ncbi:MAG: hypothetical protein J1E35_06430 [Lachnospiraceae bacterium]|nr:hypothetical protein [Lachnospiraceae bacterium]